MFCHPTELVLLVQVLELLVHLLSPILPLLACRCTAPRLTYQLSAQLVSEGRRNSCVKVPWVLETQKHVLEELSAWLADLSNEKRKLLN